MFKLPQKAKAIVLDFEKNQFTIGSEDFGKSTDLNISFHNGKWRVNIECLGEQHSTTYIRKPGSNFIEEETAAGTAAVST